MQIFGRYASVHEFSAITSPVLFVVPDKTRHDIRRDVGGWARFCHGPFDVLKIRSARLHSDLFDDAALREIAAGIEQAMDND
jgi:hypothetical protein